MFSREEKIRYSRHLLLPEVGEAGQSKLQAASVLVIGAGGLGCPALLYMAAAGVGRIGIVEFDRIDASNLQRQILYNTSAVGESKLDHAADRLRALNPEIVIEKFETKFNAANAAEILRNFDVVLDGTDNFSTRYLVNDAAVLAGKPNVHAAIYRFEGQLSVFDAQHGPCYRCLFPSPPSADAVPNCAEAGVLGVVAGIVGCLQANECIKLICGIGAPLVGRLLVFDALNMSFDEFKVEKNPACPICGNAPSITELKDLEEICSSNNGAEIKEKTNSMKEITAVELKKELASGNDILVLDVRTPAEVALGALSGAVHIPLQELAERYSELNEGKDIVVYCKSGGRSRRAIEFLQSHGFGKLRNLTGGITAWSFEVDPSIVVA